MTRVRNLADLLDSSGDVKLAHLDNTTSVTVTDNLTSTSTTEALSANQGKTLKTLADGKEAADATILKDADIGVNVQAYDSTIVVDADIGSTVQAYDADLATVASSGIGTSANQMVRLDGSAKLPAIDGSALTGMSGGAWEYIETVTASSSSTMNIEGFSSSYDNYMIVLDRLVLNNSGVQFKLKVNGSYQTSQYSYESYYYSGGNMAVSYSGNGTSMKLIDYDISEARFICYINGRNNSGYKGIFINGVALTYGQGSMVLGSGVNKNYTSDLQGVQVKSGGTFTSGNARLYGLKNS